MIGKREFKTLIKVIEGGESRPDNLQVTRSHVIDVQYMI